MVSRTRLISESAATAAGPVQHLTPKLQMEFTTVLGIADFSRTATFLFIALFGRFCETGTHTMAASVTDTLYAAITIGLVWMDPSFINMAVWAHDAKKTPFRPRLCRHD